jgi:tRNA dimethylallyltransferase
MSEKNKIIVILGPTASGKSDIAVSLALRLCSGQAKKLGISGAEIISADSRQVYKGLNIGTGKITKKEMRGVKHHLLDVASPTLRLRSGQAKRFTASDFVISTNETVVQIVERGKIPIICGGTGFYIDALLGDKQIPEVPPDQNLRKRLEKKSAEELFEMLKKMDPERAKNIDAKNPRRLVRAIEICEALEKVPPLRSDFAKATTNKQGSAGQAKYEALKIGIKVEEKELKKRINKRIEKWFKMGLLKEVKNLHTKGLSWKRMGEIGLEYKIVSLFLQSKISKSEMIKRMRTETWQYAKRQMTWFKKDKNIIWLEPKINLVEKDVIKFLQLNQPSLKLWLGKSGSTRI